MTDQYAEEKRWVFSFGLKEESERACLTEREKKKKITDYRSGIRGISLLKRLWIYVE